MKNKKKLRKVSNIKNYFSLRITKNPKKKFHSKNSRISESSNDFRSNREYSEEQGSKDHYLASTQNKSNSILTKPETKQVDVTKSTLSSFRNFKSSKRKFIDTSIMSGGSSWKSDTHRILQTLKQRKVAKLSSGRKLENIIKIYNRKDMVSKLDSLRKFNHNSHMRSTTLYNSDQKNNVGSFKWSDKVSSTYNSKLEIKNKKLNTSLYNTILKSNTLIPEIAEGETSQEVTPNSSIRKFKVETAKDKKLNNVTMRHRSEEKRMNIYRKATHHINSRRMLNSYIKQNPVTKNFVPLKLHQITASENGKNMNDGSQCNLRETSENRLIKVYLIGDQPQSPMRRNKSLNKANNGIINYVPRNDYMPSTSSGRRYMNLTKPLFWKKHMNESANFPQ